MKVTIATLVVCLTLVLGGSAAAQQKKPKIVPVKIREILITFKDSPKIDESIIKEVVLREPSLLNLFAESLARKGTTNYSAEGCGPRFVYVRLLLEDGSTIRYNKEGRHLVHTGKDRAWKMNYEAFLVLLTALDVLHNNETKPSLIQ